MFPPQWYRYIILVRPETLKIVNKNAIFGESDNILTIKF